MALHSLLTVLTNLLLVKKIHGLYLSENCCFSLVDFEAIHVTDFLPCLILGKHTMFLKLAVLASIIRYNMKIIESLTSYVISCQS